MEKIDIANKSKRWNQEEENLLKNYIMMMN